MHKMRMDMWKRRDRGCYKAKVGRDEGKKTTRDTEEHQGNEGMTMGKLEKGDIIQCRDKEDQEQLEYLREWREKHQGRVKEGSRIKKICKKGRKLWTEKFLR